MNKKAGGFGIFILLIIIAIAAGIYFKVITPEQITDTLKDGSEVISDTIKTTVTGQPSDKTSFGSIQVYFCPGDNCEAQVTNRFDQANNTIWCAFYDINSAEIVDSLNDANLRGVESFIIMDDENYVKRGDSVKTIHNLMTDNSTADYMHNKFCIIDHTTVMTGSMNPTQNCMKENNNNLIFITNPKLVDNYEAEFTEMKQGHFGKNSPENIVWKGIHDETTSIEVRFCPEDECEIGIMQELDLAKSKIHFMTFSFTSDPIMNSLLNKKSLDVKGVFETFQASSRYSAYQILKDNGLNVKLDGNPATMHHKVWIIDETTVITGSFNPSAHANKDNDENLLIIKNPEIARAYEREFDKVYRVAT